MVVLGSEALEESNRGRKRSETLPWSVGHINSALSRPGECRDVRTALDQEGYHLIVTPRSRVMEGCIAFMVTKVHVGSQLID